MFRESFRISVWSRGVLISGAYHLAKKSWNFGWTEMKKKFLFENLFENCWQPPEVLLFLRSEREFPYHWLNSPVSNLLSTETITGNRIVNGNYASAISFGWSANFGKTLVNHYNRFITTNGKHPSKLSKKLLDSSDNPQHHHHLWLSATMMAIVFTGS